MGADELSRRDPRERPPDPAGTQPRHDPDSLLPTTHESLLAPHVHATDAPPDADAEIVDAETVDVTVSDGESGDLLPERRVGAGALGARAPRPPEPPHAPRFQVLLGGLIAVAIVAIGAVVSLALDPPPKGDRGPSWSPWKPSKDGGDGAAQIAAYVGPAYKLPNGKQLVAVTGGPLEVAGLPLTIAMRDSAQEGGKINLIEEDGVLYRLCGLGEKCAIESGKPSGERHLLLRRQALELALYSFRYLDGLDEVAVLMPPAPGKDPEQALFFRRGDIANHLSRPLHATLPPPAPSVNNITRSPNVGLVNRITTQKLFKFSLTQANQDNRAFLVLDKFGQTTS
jgi:hypothetical protein